MDLSAIATYLLQPVLTFLLPGSRFNLMYVATGVTIAILVYAHASKKSRRIAQQGFVRFCFPKKIYLHASALVDYRYFIVNKIVEAILFSFMVVSSTYCADVTIGALSAVLGPAGAGVPPNLALTALTTLAVIMALDFGLFFGHYLSHRIPLLWEFHKVHHSAEVLTPLTAGRVHPVDDVLHASLGSIMSGMVYGILAYGLGPAAQEFKLWQINGVMVLFFFAGFHLRHSHVWLPLGGILGRVFVSPAHHQIHHSEEARHWGKNIGFIFALWDWAFGTLYVPEKFERIRYGIGGEEKEYNSIRRLYGLPFAKAWRRVSRRDAPGRAQTGLRL